MFFAQHASDECHWGWLGMRMMVCGDDRDGDISTDGWEWKQILRGWMGTGQISIPMQLSIQYVQRASVA